MTVNEHRSLALRDLKPGECIIQTEPIAMRGLDYRAKQHDIKLIIARDFPNLRAFIQALGRVGRYDEDCERYLVPGLTPVNKEEELALAGRLMKMKKSK